jgi:2',3'-cyclic-nucleotide 2'-phosphodiesterase (5'-nucleotidase family)
MPNLRLLCTTDLHGSLTAELARRLRELREREGALLLDCGDALTAPNVLYWPWPEAVLRHMNAAGYAAQGAGNREFFFRHAGMARQLHPAAFPILAANLAARDGSPVLPPEVVLEQGGSRVGVVGLMREMIRPGGGLEVFSDLRFLPWQGAARAAVERLRPRVDWLIALSHLGHNADAELAALCPELDLLISGHEHPPTASAKRVGEVTVVRPVPYLREVTLIRSRGEARPSEFAVEGIKL